MDFRVFIGFVTIVLTFYGYYPYFRGILRGEVRPHIFSWFIWGLLTGIGFFAQLQANAGPGAWVTGLTAILCFFVVAFAFRQGEKERTVSDWAAFVAALAAIPLWAITKDPALSVILITVIDAVAFWPTFRKSWHRPYEEALEAYVVAAVKFALAISILNEITIVTALYPSSLVALNIVFTVMVLYRRRLPARI